MKKKLPEYIQTKNLFSHVVGQIDDENNGISGIEKSFDKQLKKSKENLTLTLDKEFTIYNKK